MQTKWHIERVKYFSQDLKLTLLVSKMLLNITTIISFIAVNSSSISFVYYIVGEQCAPIKRLFSSFSGLQYEWIGSRVWIWESFCSNFIENSVGVNNIVRVYSAHFDKQHCLRWVSSAPPQTPRCPIKYWRHYHEGSCRNSWWEQVVINFTYSLKIAAEETYYNQSVHNILTGLQAGCTCHFQEQLFCRLLDL